MVVLYHIHPIYGSYFCLMPKRSRVNHYVDVPLHYNGKQGMAVYKPAGNGISENRIRGYAMPQLFIRETDKFAAIRESQREFRKLFEEHVEAGMVYRPGKRWLNWWVKPCPIRELAVLHLCPRW